MIEELKRAFYRAEQLPEEQQKILAELIRNELDWEHSFQSSAKLSILGKEALTEHKENKTKALEF